MSSTRFLILLACLLGLGHLVSASTASPLDLAALPSCAASCILQEMGRSDCGLGNQTCLCNDEAYNGYVETCVIANCTVKQQLVTKNQTLASCGKLSSTEADDTLQWLRVILFVLPTFFFAVRIASKFMKLSPWGWDDTTLVLGYIVLSAFMPANYFITEAGSGRDMWTLTPEQISTVLLIVYIFTLCYTTSLTLIKASIIFLYLRIFPDETVRRILWCVQVLNLVLWVAFMAPTVVMCQPISFFWDGWMKESEGKCINFHASSVSHSVLQLLLDVVMLAIPATQIWGLNMNIKKKVGVYLIFGVGIFLTAVSGYRIRSLIVFATSDNPTVNTYEAAIWSHVELCVGVFVACLPATRQLWNKLFPIFIEMTGIKWRPSSEKGFSPGNTPPPTIGQGKKPAAGKRSWLSRLADEVTTTTTTSSSSSVPLSDVGTASSSSLVESKERRSSEVRRAEEV